MQAHCSWRCENGEPGVSKRSKDVLQTIAGNTRFKLKQTLFIFAGSSFRLSSRRISGNPSNDLTTSSQNNSTESFTNMIFIRLDSQHYYGKVIIKAREAKTDTGTPI